MAEDKTSGLKRSAEEAFNSMGREGYFGNREPNILSNAMTVPGERIVLDKSYGHPAEPSPQASTAAESSPQGALVGLAGRYKDKVTIVTGGSKGIGEGCVRCFFKAGSNVVFCSRTKREGEKLLEELNASRAEGEEHRALFVEADVSKVDDVYRVIDTTIETFGRLDCLINNAGWHPPPKVIDDFTVTEMQDLFQLNFISIFAACKHALPHLRKTRGNIINMSSWVGVFGQAQAPTYTATKGAITSFSKGIALDEAKNGVRVNIVSPGNIWTPLWKSWSDGEVDPSAAREAGDRVQVMGRKGTIIETGRLCFAIAADFTFTTGIDHLQSGGAELGYGIRS